MFVGYRIGPVKLILQMLVIGPNQPQYEALRLTRALEGTGMAIRFTLVRKPHDGQSYVFV